MFHNVIIGSPIVEPKTLIALDDVDWETNEKEKTLFTDTRFLPVKQIVDEKQIKFYLVIFS